MRFNRQSLGLRSGRVDCGVLSALSRGGAQTDCQYAPFTLSIEPYLSAA
jgi:hypothetical protein